MARKRLKRPLPIARVLDETLKNLGVAVKLKQRTVWTLWGDVVGPAISAHAQPSGVSDGRLFVSVEDSLWLHQLNYLKHQILMELNSQLGNAALREIVLRVGEVKSPLLPSRKTDSSSTNLPALAAQDEERMREILSPVKELPCREVLQRVLLLHFCRKESSPRATIR